ncbi:ABC multidrug transporter C like protein [Verticillium longisporum]|uniref:ABC multidrug transporter C like protein n=1 Tax=Verticillium longisporum TaxID=100787 RepID=A0A8I2ZW33_VERLO|nr:ABC multidrug transporter C like protein [Verticillium longisporum]
MGANSEEPSAKTHIASSRHSSSTEVSETHDQVEALARRITAQSARLDHGTANSALNPVKGSNLDPFSADFDRTLWTQAYIREFEADPDTAPPRKAGVAFRNLGVFGHTSGDQYQQSTGNILLSLTSTLAGKVTGRAATRVDILQGFDGIVDPKEMLLVLGPPGSGCSTFLKTLSGRTDGLNITEDSYINFTGIDPSHMHNWFRGDVLYNAEVDVHLAPLSVGDTLEFAARARVPAKIPGGFNKNEYARIMRDVIMATFGISHTIDTKVGDDIVRGVSGGERKRVSIAEACLTGAKFQCWDNSTRGLDSANAISFCKTLRVQADIMNVAAVVAIYQAPQAAYETFDKVTVLYEGRQIYFGRTENAKHYFEQLGFECPDRQTTADFLTSMTSPHERRIRAGCEQMVPNTPDEFAARWRDSQERAALITELDQYDAAHPQQQRMDEFTFSRKVERSSVQRLKSPYTIPYFDQVMLCIWRGWKRLIADPGFTVAQLGFNLIMGLVLGSAFYNLSGDTSSFYPRGAVVFFALLFNAFASELEVLTLYIQRPVVEKHNRYAFYHQSAEAISSYVLELPYKVTNAILFNTIVYFLANLRREPGAFFFFVFTVFLILLIMSGVYRTMASIARTSDQALVPVALITMGVMVYTGFTIPVDYMPGWSRWMNYINPLAYGFEALLANEYHGREFPCASIAPAGPGYDDLPLANRTCTVVGAVPGDPMVSGDRYIEISFGYYHAHKWRNIGILFGFLIFFFCTYIFAAEYAKPPVNKGEVLLYRRGKLPAFSKKPGQKDEESQTPSRPISEKPAAEAKTDKLEKEKRPSPSTCGKPIFHWEDVCYDVKIKGNDRRILDHVDGWVQPGVVTALMGSSGAGKTTLLDALATRVTMGVLTGDTLVNGKPTDMSFPHRVGYVQQQDLHMNTMTVREALEFSAILRQSAEIPRAEKLAYVDEVIKTLEMEAFVDAVIGVPGEGLNVEQRKRLTIGVELAARPQLLVFLDEPTSGLDSQTSWAICDLIERLAKSGQAVLCTIHQPSAMLFSRFDRLLLLQPGGKTVYFGDIGAGSRTMIDYLERNGAPPCPPAENPAEWMLKVALPSTDGPDWFSIWHNSPEYRETKAELQRLRDGNTPVERSAAQDLASQHNEFVASFWTQFREVLLRVFKHFWRSPSYLWSKIAVTGLLALYIGFSFTSSNSLQGLQNQLYAFFMAFLIFNPFNKQIMPMFVPQRALYEVRERPSKIYRWSAFMLSNVVVEFVWNTAAAALFFFCWYYPAGFFKNTTSDDVTIRGFTTFLFIWQLFLWISTVSQFVIAAIEHADLASVPAALICILALSFCGIGTVRSTLPAIWADFMYRVSPMTYLASGALSTALHGAKVVCRPEEIVRIPAQAAMSCAEFLEPYSQRFSGYLVDVSDETVCGWCPMSTTDDYLATFEISFGDRWRNFGIGWAFILFNIVAACGLYWLFRVPRGQGIKRK